MSAAKRASPVASLVALNEASDAPAGPVAMLAVTLTPWVATGFPFASCTCTAGCCANGAPLWAVAEGGVVSASCPAAAAMTLNCALVATPGMPPVVAVNV